MKNPTECGSLLPLFQASGQPMQKIEQKEQVGPGFSPDKDTIAILATLSGLKPGPTCILYFDSLLQSTL
jgi:hypothetical protein